MATMMPNVLLARHSRSRNRSDPFRYPKYDVRWFGASASYSDCSLVILIPRRIY